MQESMQFIEGLFSLSSEQQIFVIAVLAISVIGFALYVVLAALKNGGGREDLK